VTVLSRAQLEERRDETRAEVSRLRDQRSELLARAQRDDALNDSGVREKVERLTTGIERAEAEADDAGRALLNDRLQQGDVATEAGTNFGNGGNRRDRVED
jgi:hypothetical protein